MGDPERALDGVVVADRDEAHPTALAHPVDALGIAERLAEPRSPQRIVPAVRRERRVNVQIAQCLGAHCL